MSQCCVLCTLVRPACSRSASEPVASVNVRVVDEHASVAVLGGRSVLQCSARAAAFECCLLELHATERCNSPVENISNAQSFASGNSRSTYVMLNCVESAVKLQPTNLS